jgi:hypothetical protein
MGTGEEFYKGIYYYYYYVLICYSSDSISWSNYSVSVIEEEALLVADVFLVSITTPLLSTIYLFYYCY